MIIVSYVTKNTPYIEVMKTHLLPSLEKWHLPHDIKYIEDLGSWQKNTHYKATFLKEALLKHKQPIVFLDADATIEQYPKLFYEIPKNADIAIHHLDWRIQYKRPNGQPMWEALSGTMYLNYNDKVLAFLDKWIEQNKLSNAWEQSIMGMVLKESDLNIHPLPYSYISILQLNGEMPWQIKKEDIIILHHQVSRQFKRRK